MFFLTPSSVRAAESIKLKVGLFQQQVKVTELEEFVKTGTQPSGFKLYKLFLTAEVRRLLSSKLDVESKIAHEFIDQLFRYPDGEKLILQLLALPPNSSVSEVKAALTLTVKQTSNFSPIALLRAFPQDNITIDLSPLVSMAVQRNIAYLKGQFLSALLDKQLSVNSDSYSERSFNSATPGVVEVIKHSWGFKDAKRSRLIPTTVYYSHDSKMDSPVVVISPGFAADRSSFNYLAHHLASHGLSVVVLEHSGSNVQYLQSMKTAVNWQNLFAPTDLIARPQDVSYILDQLEEINQLPGSWQGKFNTAQATVIGHSFGGYTAMALAGAVLDLPRLRSVCQELNPWGRSFADWFQCGAVNLGDKKVSFRDQRVVQVIALNPIIGNGVFGDSLKQVTIPTLILISSEDGITPYIDHQLLPFTQLTKEKYLVTALGATHMSATDISTSKSIMGRNTLVREIVDREAEPLRKLIQGLSLAFIKQKTASASIYQPFLTSAYVQSYSTETITLRWTSQLPDETKYWLNLLNWGRAEIRVNSCHISL